MSDETESGAVIKAPEKSPADQWVEALESGEYKQVKGRLKGQLVDGGWGFCCLGVGCDLYMKATGEGSWVNGALVIDNNGEPSHSASYMPRVVVGWLGLASDCGKYNGNGVLAYDNDHDRPFSEIAATIKRRPPGLFREQENGN